MCIDQDFVLLPLLDVLKGSSYAIHFLSISTLEMVLTAISVRVSILTVSL